MALAEVLPTSDPTRQFRITGDTPFDPRPVVVLLLAAWGFNYELKNGITTSLVAGLVSIPLWLPALRRYRFGRLVVGLGILAIAAGALQALYLSSSLPYDGKNAFAQSMLMVSVVTGIGLILWARTVISVKLVGSVLALAILAGTAQAIAGSDNPWKFVLSVPIAVLVLSLVSGRGAWVQMTALGVLGLLSAAFDSRSFFGICLLAAGLLFAQRLGLRPARGWLGPITIAALGAFTVGLLVTVGTQLAVQGELGEKIAQRTQEQILRGGNLIAGGRPEWAGTLGLMAEQPAGFGFGAVPTYQNVWSAREGLDTVGIGTDNTYVDNYMFDGQFKLHSTAADMWSQMGVVGFVYAGVLLLAVFVSVVDRLRASAMTGLVGLLAVKALWDIGFSPIFSSAIWLGVTMGLVLFETAERRAAITPGGPLEQIELRRPELV